MYTNSLSYYYENEETSGTKFLIYRGTEATFIKKTTKYRGKFKKKETVPNLMCYRSGTVNSNIVNSKFHLIRSYCEYLSRILSFHV